MKYAPGNYSVTFFDNVGTKIDTVYKDPEGALLLSLHHATFAAERALERVDDVESYVIHRVIVNSAVKKAAV